jgi:GMP synthase (glutamine-hydrolysing)
MYNMSKNNPLSVALLDASVGDTPAERNVGRELEAEVRTYKVSEGVLPPSPSEALDAFDAVVVSGSQTAVYDDEPWIAETEAWLRGVVDRGMPVLGICWGHQLLAQATGGDVDPMGEYELGYVDVDLLAPAAADPLFAGVDDPFVAFETHSDEVTRLPGAATPLAETDRALQAFRIANAWGVQFHPEYDLDTARWVTENKRGHLTDDRVDAVLETVTPERHAETAAARRTFANFLAFARDRRARAERRPHDTL